MAGARSSWRTFAGLARQATALPRFLRHPLAAETVGPSVLERVRQRDAQFLTTAERLIYGAADNPTRQLLRAAGCELGDLRQMVTTDGLEAALELLRARGVRVSADEFRGRTSLRRSGLELSLRPHDFVNPAVDGAVKGSTSGTTEARTSQPTKLAGPEARPEPRRSAAAVAVSYSWSFLATEAASEWLLLDSHGLLGAPLALWLPRPPGIAGLHNLLAHAKQGRPPERWFSPSPPPRVGDGLAYWVERGCGLARRLLPALGPGAESVPPDRAVDVARWLAGAPRPALLKCFASAALRVAAAAMAENLDVSGQVIFAGGEPLGEARQRFLSATGLRVYARYAATETGFLAGACPAGTSGSDMHLFSDRVALVNGAASGVSGPLAVSTLTLDAPLVLLNVELGDHGALRRAPCACALGAAGLEWRVAEVESPDKIAAEGVKLGEIDFADLVEAAVGDLGGTPDDFQIWLGDEASGASHPTVVVAPQTGIEPAALRAALRERLGALPGGALAAHLWLDAGALAVERRPLAAGAGYKRRRVVRVRRAPGSDP